VAGLYLHIPFCKQACYYCDFHFSTDIRYKHELIGCLQRELVYQQDYLSEPLRTIYLGGGTPSLLSCEELTNLLNTVRSHYAVAADTEITLEANPDDLKPDKLKELLDAGINRLSIGIQSFDDTILKFLHRSHHATSAKRCLEEARTAGFQNLSLDLIYAIPGLSEAQWGETIREAIRFQPEHISSYALTIEERTVFGNWSRRGKLDAGKEEIAARQFETLMDLLPAAGYEHYEISNFSKPGYHSRHNSSYWKQSPYLGIGPSAHSFNGTSRQFNIRNNAAYMRSIQAGKIPAEYEILTRENKINEYILTTLRTQWGCDLNFLAETYQDLILERKGAYITMIQERGLVVLENNILSLTRAGKLVADSLVEELMVEC